MLKSRHVVRLLLVSAALAAGPGRAEDASPLKRDLPEALQARVDQAIRDARTFLYAQLDKGLAPNPSRNHMNGLGGPGEDALIALALVQSGVPASDPLLRKVWRRVHSRRTGKVYTASVGDLSAGERQAIHEGLRDALGWFQANWPFEIKAIVSEKLKCADGYSFYALERVGVLAGLKRLGEHGWYPEGAEALVGAQSEDGAWAPVVGGYTVEANTAFCLLFLSHATSERFAGYEVGEAEAPRP